MLTLITPTLNAARTLGALLDNVSHQSIPVCQHLIIDGGSTDETRSIADRYPHTTWVDAPGSSIFGAQNIGIGMATGELIYFLGADDLFASNDVVENVLREMGDHDVLEGLVSLGGFHPRYVPQQQGRVYRRSLYSRFGLYDEGIPVLADVAFDGRLKEASISRINTRIVLANFALGGVSSRGAV